MYNTQKMRISSDIFYMRTCYSACAFYTALLDIGLLAYKPDCSFSLAIWSGNFGWARLYAKDKKHHLVQYAMFISKGVNLWT